MMQRRVPVYENTHLHIYTIGDSIYCTSMCVYVHVNYLNVGFWKMKSDGSDLL